MLFCVDEVEDMGSADSMNSTGSRLLLLLISLFVVSEGMNIHSGKTSSLNGKIPVASKPFVVLETVADFTYASLNISPT